MTSFNVEKFDTAGETSEQQRCICNKLLCIVRENTIEIKCNKCKRIMLIKTKGIENVEVR